MRCSRQYYYLSLSTCSAVLYICIYFPVILCSALRLCPPWCFSLNCVFSGQVRPQRAMFVADYMFNGAVCPPLYLSLILCLAVQLSTMISVTDLVFSRVICLQQFWSLISYYSVRYVRKIYFTVIVFSGVLCPLWHLSLILYSVRGTVCLQWSFSMFLCPVM